MQLKPLLAHDEEAGRPDEGNQCRICLGHDDQDSMIAPCRCAGTARWVHRACLDEWRAQERLPLAFSQCPTCKFVYRTHTVVDDATIRRARLRFRTFVARDFCGVFAAVQGTIAATAFLMHCIDRSEWVATLYPKAWAARTHDEHLSIGPYYCSACVVLLALLGLVGLVLKLTGRMPAPPRHHNANFADCGYYCGSCCDGTCQGCILSDCPAAGASGCADTCSTATAGCGEAAVMFVPVLLVILCIFALIGVVVGIFFVTIVTQRIVMRHYHLLAMRSETQRIVVIDLADRPAMLHEDAAGGGSAVAPLSLRRNAGDASELQSV